MEDSTRIWVLTCVEDHEKWGMDIYTRRFEEKRDASKWVRDDLGVSTYLLNWHSRQGNQYVNTVYSTKIVEEGVYYKLRLENYDVE